MATISIPFLFLLAPQLAAMEALMDALKEAPEG